MSEHKQTNEKITNYNLVKKQIIDYRDPHTKYTTNYYLNHLLPRTDGPAIEHPNGDAEYYLFVKRHRIDGPAIIFSTRLEYWINGIRHNTDDQPAIIHKYKNEKGDSVEDKEYFNMGVKHRIGGPAEIRADGTTMYYIDGIRHNEDGPAIVYGSCYMTKHMFYFKGKLHNTKGPAIVYRNGSVEYWVNNQLHNDNGPAVIDSDGNSTYCIHGEFIQYISRESASTERLAHIKI